MTLSIASLVFALITCGLYYIVGKRSRKYLLALASFVYVYNLNRLAGIYVLFTSLLCWAAGAVVYYFKKEKRTRIAKWLCYISVAFFASGLLILKYLPVYYPKYLEGETVLKNLIMPIGFSFYVFQAISYIVDVKRGTTTGVKNPVNIFLYLSFFPKFISGPIERYGDFKLQIVAIRRTRFKEPDRWKSALYYALFGCFMKLVIADRLVTYVNQLFDNYQNYGSIMLLMGSLLYTIQIYCDFAGYSYVAMGIAKLYGVNLSENFKQPYMSANITEFWRRWHMSLSRWFTDYIYIPLGGNRKGLPRKIINTLIVFIICGMWHGAGKNFIVWGLLHGLFSAFDVYAREKKWTVLRSGILGHILAFAEASFAWIFFRSSSFSSAMGYIIAMLTNGLQLKELSAQMELIELVNPEPRLIVFLIIVMIVLDIIAYKKGRHIPEIIAELPQGRRYLCFYALIMLVLIFGIYGPNLGVKPIYMEF